MHLYSVRVSSSFIATNLLLAAIVAFAGGIWFAKMQQDWINQTYQNTASAPFDTQFPSSHLLSNHILLPTPQLANVDSNDNGDSCKDETLHYLVEIFYQGDGFLHSKERMLSVLFQLIDTLDIGPPLSQHCHEPVSLRSSAGVHCIVVLEKLGHVSILTSPKAHTSK